MFIGKIYYHNEGYMIYIVRLDKTITNNRLIHDGPKG